MTDSAPQLLWLGAGEPPHKYVEEDVEGFCATCAVLIKEGVDTDQVNNPTFANHAEFFRFGTHVCRACAWLYGDPKRTHRNVLAVGEKLWWPMISVDSATEERPSWLDLFRSWPEDDEARGRPVCGVLTTDPKPRNWPRMRISTAAKPMLYVHAPDYDVSGVRALDLEILGYISAAVMDALRRGFPKSRIYAGLPGDHKRAKKDIRETMRLEETLREVRGAPEFVPALLVSGLTKEEKNNDGSHRAEGSAGDSFATGRLEPAGATRGVAHEDDHRLF